MKKNKILYFLLALLLCLPLFFLVKPKPKYYLSVCAIFRNEARFLREWIEYHRIVGVEHFYLYNNLSEDNYYDVLKPYVDSGIIELFQWPHQGKNQKEWNKIQCGAYSDLIKKKKKETFWLAIIDTDEFILPLSKNTVSEFLKDYEEYGGLVINWQLFGTSVKRIPENDLLVRLLTKKAPEDFYTNRFVKSIVQPKKVKKVTQPHSCRYKEPYFHVTENKISFPRKSILPYVSVNKIRINHYISRDEQFFYEEKQRRIREWHPGSPPIKINPELNVIEDRAIFTYMPELNERLFGDNTN